MKTEIPLSPCQQKAFELLDKSADNIFLTGSAGTGKSFLVRKFLQDRDRKTFPIVASTGVAAILVGGRTFHSFFGLGIMEGGVERTIEKAAGDRRVTKRLRAINGFILDEVSMISGSALKAAEAICRLTRGKKMPWGGARVIAVGDFAQLPPVNRYGEDKEWAFLDEVWQRSEFKSAVLNTILRTQDEEFVRILNFVRHGVVNDEVRAYLARKVDADVEDPRATHLFPTRLMADRYNSKRLAEIDAPLRDFVTEYAGNERSVDQLKKNAPIPEVLKIKKSAQVMIRINDPGFRFVNGTVGTIEDINSELLTVRLKKGTLVELGKETFSLLSPEGQPVATATNFPVTLAYAMTIHKSQGVTLERLVADLRGLWEPGQAYVGLSRLKSGDGLSLTGWDEASIRSDPTVAAFHESL